MATTDLRRQVIERVKRLSPERLRVADDFLAYLEEREADEATEELLRIPGFLAALEQAERDVEAGDVTPVEDLPRRY